LQPRAHDYVWCSAYVPMHASTQALGACLHSTEHAHSTRTPLAAGLNQFPRRPLCVTSCLLHHFNDWSAQVLLQGLSHPLLLWFNGRLALLDHLAQSLHFFQQFVERYVVSQIRLGIPARCPPVSTRRLHRGVAQPRPLPATHSVPGQRGNTQALQRAMAQQTTDPMLACLICWTSSCFSRTTGTSFAK
jgi:hypothetical protein